MGSIFVLHGADHKVGTTMIAQSVAETIAASQRDLKVAMIALHGGYGTDYIKDHAVSLERLKTDISGRLLTGEKLYELSKYKDNLNIIGGIGSVGVHRDYFPDTAEYLLGLAREVFDIVLADSGSEIDCGIAAGALKHGESRFMLMTQNETVLSRCEAASDIYNRLGIDFPEIIINKFKEDDPYDLAYFSRRFGFGKASLRKIAYAENGRKAESDHRSLMHYNNRKYRKDVSDMAMLILRRAGKIDVDSLRKGFKWNDLK